MTDTPSTAEKDGQPNAPAPHGWYVPPYTSGDKNRGMSDLLKEATAKVEALSPSQQSVRHGQLRFARSRLEEVLLLLSSDERQLQRVCYTLNALESEREPYQPGYASHVWEAFSKASFSPDAAQPKKVAPLKTTNQVGGGHYEKLTIDPYAYCHANKLEGIESNVIKYVTRWRDKGGIQDLEKAVGSLQRLIELEKANPR